ncbi:MAG: phosphoribosylaminoimidazolecarboxamide formyltransferase / cyclohydrolase [Thermotogaceae bacterium]|jgi:phosphoribosylaminoimidazolecarboxamide formyltransferase/IMP cyclohydrolase|nr:phosphoribosylaminoimidazolecarboxamide formyltransferase / cyclohydrolase [Thermotogaceae bacterium]
MVRRVLISLSDKNGIEELAKFLAENGAEILSTGGTASFLRKLGIEVKEVSEETKFPEILSGRVKTLHPHIFGGILRRDNIESDLKELEKTGIKPIDMVVVNLYPFEMVSEKTNDEDTLIENIDIGGVTLIRAAAKNYKNVIVIVDPKDYNNVLEQLKTTGDVDLKTRKKLALKAFERTVKYDSAILQKLSEVFNELPVETIIAKNAGSLRYGENPHQSAFIYKFEAENLLDKVEILHGIELSYNNWLDSVSVINMLRDFPENSAVIVKHTNPCGAAWKEDTYNSYKEALSTDPLSAYGGIVGIKGKVDEKLAQALNEHFFEIVIALDYDNDALDILRKKKKRRIVKLKEFPKGNYEYRFLDGIILKQEKDKGNVFDKFDVKTDGKVSEEQKRELEFAMTVCKHVKSNAIVISKNMKVLGIGAGQMSRVDALKIALMKAKEFGHDLRDSFLASDAFFPFADSIEIAHKAGIKFVVEPGGSIRDDEVIQKAQELGITLVFSGKRHFKH